MKKDRQATLFSNSRHIEANHSNLPPAAQARGGNAFPNIPLFSHRGERFRLYEDLIKNRIVVLHFFSIHGQKQFPSIAHMTRIVKQLKGRLGEDVFVYSISQDIRDTPARLKRFASKIEVPQGWELLAALPEDVMALSDRLQRSACSSGRHGSHSPRLVHYGNGGVGMWGAFGIDSDPAFAAERISWVVGGRVVSATPKRAGPRRLGTGGGGNNREA